MVVFLTLHPMGSTSLNSFVFLELLAILLTSTLAINCLLRNFLNKVICIINFIKPFLNCIDDTMIWYLNSKLDLKSLWRLVPSEPEFYGDLVYRLKKKFGSNNFSAQFIKIIPIVKRFAITMFCNRLHAWWSTQSRLATLLSSLIARHWFGFRLYNSSDLKTYLLIRW